MNAGSLQGKLVVDQPENQHNMTLWAEILNIRHRTDGMKGVEAVWKGMRRRGVDIPLNGEVADILWKAFIQATIRSPTSWDPAGENSGALNTEKVFAYARDLKERSACEYPALYKLIVGQWLRVDPGIAAQWHHRLVAANFGRADSFLDTLDDLMTAGAPAQAFRQFFRPLYQQVERRDLYDTVLSHAFKHELSQERIIRYHKFLLYWGDWPSESFVQDSRISNLFRLVEDQDYRKLSKQQGPKKPEGSASKPYVTFNREMMNTIVGDVHDIKPKEISDTFCARMFATRAFSIGWVIKGLALFGAERLGPLATREMAIRAGSPKGFRDALAELKEASIEVGDAVFCRLAVRLAQDDNAELWQTLMESDQHPESYDDSRTQRDLLSLFQSQKMWSHIHLSLLAASIAGSRASLLNWNKLLQYYMQEKDYFATFSLLESMQSQRIPLTPFTIGQIRRHILPLRQRGKRPIKGLGPGFFEPSEFVARVYIYSTEMGTPPNSVQWIEVLKRLGMNHQWKQLERVVLTLLTPLEFPSADDGAFGDEKGEHLARLQEIFLPNMCKAIFIWGFRSASVRDQLRPSLEAESCDAYSASGRAPFSAPSNVETWAQGLHLLTRLRKAGLEFTDEDVCAVFIQRMWILFGPAYSTRAINHEARRVNQLSLAHYIRHANTVWPELIYWVEPELLQHDGDPRLLSAFFGTIQPTSLRWREFADVEAWAKALSSGREFIIEPKKTPHKERAWMNSPLRMTYTPTKPEPTPVNAFVRPV